MPIGVQSIIAVGLGALIGSLAPAAGEQMKILGDVFLNLVQVVVLPLVFPLIVLGRPGISASRRCSFYAPPAPRRATLGQTLVPQLIYSLTDTSLPDVAFLGGLEIFDR
ncbi:hypothetical protein SGFS_054320 [Streptomyces graminofaciens]|uniref:Uncharacterized protein n=1 Tax=Streptomyces graminofaciens TaxID=68212 RepID=A0ABN5VNY1_9ACTN|nr:cation:dicarboxylase symporter family transporter [Streptomyces graminofaciens]BBC34138.1 hypothetical protein SGFS_054320 [Streptomyces graminofaciens]